MLKPGFAASLAAALLAGHAWAQAGTATDDPPYILNGFSVSGVPGVKPDDLIAVFPQKEGDRMTKAIASADQALLAKELKDRHIKGRLFTTYAEKNGHVWVLFDFQSADAPQPVLHPVTLTFQAQTFAGNRKLSSGALAAATGLKPGDALPDDRIEAAEDALNAAYGKAFPHARTDIEGAMSTASGGKVTLKWTITEPK